MRRKRALHCERLENRHLLATDLQLVSDINPAGGSFPVEITPSGNITFFTAATPGEGRELWRTNGTASGTSLVRDIAVGPTSGIDAVRDTESPGYLTDVNGTLFFVADDGSGEELWTSDGTAGGTVRVRDIFAGTSGSYPRQLTNVNGTLFFTAIDPVVGRELWMSDGTAAGTVLVADLDPRRLSGSYPQELTNLDGTLYFSAETPLGGRELWLSDGTAAGTTQVADINPGTDSHSNPAQLTNVNGVLFFSATNGVDGVELWRSDGTAGGTAQVRDINAGPLGSNPARFVNVGGTLFFSAQSAGTTGLWRSNGTAAGTVLVKDLSPGTGGIYPRQLTNSNGTLYFVAGDATGGAELWRSNGTDAGTVRVADINPGTAGSYPTLLTNVSGKLYFNATDAAGGSELWKSRGDAATTFQTRDLVPGTGGSNPTELARAGADLYFSASTSTTGRELWRAVAVDPTVNVNAGSNVVEDAGVDTITSAELSTSVLDYSPDRLRYVVVSSPSGGRLELTTAPGVRTTTFTQADINAGRLVYRYAGDETRTSDQFAFQVVDGDGGSTPTAVFQFSITHVNDAPTLTVITPRIPEGARFAIPPSALRATDPDDAPVDLIYNVTSAPQAGILVRSSAPAVPITTFTQADIIARRVIYLNQGEATTDSFSFNLSDGAATVPGLFSFDITPVNDAPRIVLGGTATYVENAPPVVLAPSATLSDPDASAVPFRRLIVTNRNGNANDRLTIAPEGSAAGQVDLQGNVVLVGGTRVGNVSGGSARTPLVVAFDSTASLADMEAVARRVAFRTLGDTPSTVHRQIAFQVTDGEGGRSGVALKTVNVIATDDLAAFAIVSGAAGYLRGDPAVAVAKTVSLSDVDSLTFGGYKLTAEITKGGGPGDTLFIGGPFTVVGTEVRLNNRTIGRLDGVGGIGTNKLVVTFSSGANAPNVQTVKQLVLALRFQTTSWAAVGPRAISLSLTDLAGRTVIAGEGSTEPSEPSA